MKQMKIWECGWWSQMLMKPALLSQVSFIQTAFFTWHISWMCREAIVFKNLTPDNSLDLFYSLYVNKFVDHHTFEITF
jgi:hypothetical protein